MQILSDFFCSVTEFLLRDSKHTEAMQIAYATPRRRTFPNVPSPLQAPCLELHVATGFIPIYAERRYAYYQKHVVWQRTKNHEFAYIPQDANVNSVGARLREDRSYNIYKKRAAEAALYCWMSDVLIT